MAEYFSRLERRFYPELCGRRPLASVLKGHRGDAPGGSDCTGAGHYSGRPGGRGSWRTSHDQQRPGKHNPVLGVLNVICQIYTTVIRGTPIMVQLLIMYFVIFASTRNQIGVAMLTFGVNSGAYVSEIIRGGIMSIDKGQMKAGRSLGLPYATTMRFVVIPQAIKNILPALGNELITLLKDTSIVTVIGLRDLTKAAQLVQGKTYQAFMPYVGIAVLYLAMVMILSGLMGLLERRMRASD